MKLDNIAPYLSATGFGLISIDANDTGADDLAGQFLLYGGDLIFAVQSGADLPPLPDVASNALGGKLSTTARLALMLAGINLTIVRGQVSASKPHLAQALRYITQAISALMASRPIPALPAAPTT
ncbi:MAG: hypothetical protein ACREAB_01590 [Blastocatellia bacterium]